MQLVDRSYRRIWQLSLGSFILAALTGFLFRLGMLTPLPDLFDLVNIRHAHSHLMFFNWISPPIMAWMASRVAADHSRYKKCLYTMLFLGLISYPFFLMYGYQSVLIGSANLPVAAIISGFVMFTWYWFAWLYYSDRKRNGDSTASPSLFMFDGALAALLISSLGAWGVSVFQFSGSHNPLLSSALTHFFLGVFTEGWALLGVLGILWDQLSDKEISISPGWLWKPILLGSMLLFPFSLTRSLIPPLMLYSAKIGIILVLLSLYLHLYFLKNLNGFIWKSVIALLGIKIIFQIVVLLPVDIWPGEHGLRILYLHLLLLGIGSVTLIRAFYPEKQFVSKQLFTGAVLLVLASLVLISGYWPSRLAPAQPYVWVTIIAVAPVLPASWLLWGSFQHQ